MGNPNQDSQSQLKREPPPVFLHSKVTLHFFRTAFSTPTLCLRHVSHFLFFVTLADGQQVKFQGPGRVFDIVTRIGNSHYCSCEEFKEQKGKVGEKTCQHIAQVTNGSSTPLFTAAATGKKRAASAKTNKSSTSTGSGVASTPDHNKKAKTLKVEAALAKPWDQKSSICGYCLSEKLDGMRCIYDGKGGLWTRNGNPVACPRSFSDALPRNICLDGELFLSRAMFQQCMSITRSMDGNEEDWKRITFVVFDAPETQGDFPTRLQAARLAMEGCNNPRIVTTLPQASPNSIFSKDLDDFRASQPLPVVATLLPQTSCRGKIHAWEELERITKMGGEGIMLRKMKGPYRGGRSSDLLKLKTFIDEEAIVIGHDAGKGKHAGRLGALVCHMMNSSSKTFKIGTGFTDAQREDPPPIGSTITYRYFEETNAGLPRFPSFLRVRPSE